MNYTSAAVGVSALIAIITWITTRRKNFTGPQRGGILDGMGRKEVDDVHHVKATPIAKRFED